MKTITIIGALFVAAVFLAAGDAVAQQEQAGGGASGDARMNELLELPIEERIQAIYGVPEPA